MSARWIEWLRRHARSLMVGLLLMVLITALLYTGWAMARHNRLPARGAAPMPMPYLSGSPIMRLQLARNDAEFRAVLDTPPTTRKNVTDAMTGNRLDSTYFIPLYTALLVVLALAGRGECRLPRWLPAALIAAIAAAVVFDYRENAAIYTALDSLSAGRPIEGATGAIRPNALAKWMLLMAVCLIMAAIYTLQRRRIRQAAGVLFLAAAASIGMDLLAFALDR